MSTCGRARRTPTWWPTLRRRSAATCPAIGFDDVANPTRFHCHTKVATRFRSGRILLAGDAAHVCSPSQGHGMNSGLQDAFNLAWKLALVCQGHCAPALLDSYEAERRPVAEMITASGDAVEHAQTVTDPAERRARDETLRAVFADPTSRHHEAIAEAELDIDYARLTDRHGRRARGARAGPAAAGHDRGSSRQRRGLHAARVDQPRRPHGAAHRRIVGARRRARAARQLHTCPK